MSVVLSAALCVASACFPVGAEWPVDSATPAQMRMQQCAQAIVLLQNSPPPGFTLKRASCVVAVKA